MAAAFESLQRFYVFGGDITDTMAIRIFGKLGFSKVIFNMFKDIIKEPRAFEAAGIHHVLNHIVSG